MELKLEKDANVAVQVDGEPFILSEDGKIWQRIEEDKIFMLIKSGNGEKEIKIQITKK